MLKKTLTIYDHTEDNNWEERFNTINTLLAPFGLFIEHNVVKVPFSSILFEKEYGKDKARVNDKFLRTVYFSKCKTDIGLVYWNLEQAHSVKPKNKWRGQSIDDTYCSEICMLSGNGTRKINSKLTIPEWEGRFLHELCHCVFDHRQFMGKPELDTTHYWEKKGNLFKAFEEWQLPQNFVEEVLLKVENAVKPGYKYFSSHEIQGLKPELVALLDKARDIAGIPFVLTSTLRSPEKNSEVGGVKDSAHLHGEAVDIRVRNSSERFIISKALHDVGFTRIGIAETFIHADISTVKSQNVLWLY